ncbi:MAG: hypothetical protein GQ569_04155 [Methylococcaceae bacterium]|nr:hypothetical protein [Methylococcaceae bacterium]
MGFKQIKHQLIQCLEQGYVIHEQRGDIDIKNLLAIGEISTNELIEIIKQTRGNEYENSPHHYDSNITVHILKTNCAKEGWYIKWYFNEPDSVFISIHH